MKENALQQLYRLVKQNCFQTVEWTLEKSSWRWQRFWSMLVGYGFRFEKDDIKKLQTFCEKNLYRTSFYRPDEQHYSQAVIVGNTSFAVAYEDYTGRKPFFFKGVDYKSRYSNRPEGFRPGTQSKSQGRLILGCEFPWQGELVTVTSFNDEKQTLIVCAYHPSTPGEVCKKCGVCISGDHDGGIKKRFTITPEDLRLAMKAMKQDAEPCKI